VSAVWNVQHVNPKTHCALKLHFTAELKTSQQSATLRELVLAVDFDSVVALQKTPVNRSQF
jgi:hypothetical protein